MPSSIDKFKVAAVPLDAQDGRSLLEHPLIRAERTPEVVAVSGVYRESRESLKTLPGIPQTNLTQGIWNTILKDTDTGELTINHDLVQHYLDCIEKVKTSEPKSYLPLSSKKCGLWAKIGQCENGHRFAVRVFCGKPWCLICRDIIHHRKIASLLPEVQQLLPAAYLVIRPPNQLQPLFLPRGARRRFIGAVIKALKTLGYRRGLIFIHYFGDDPTRYAFHLNILVDGGWLEPEQLDDLKRKLRRLIYPRSVIRKWGDKLDIFYEYLPTQGQVYHTLEYCSRATFRQFEGNEQLADSIRGEHSIRRWGRWVEEPKWHLAESAKKLQSLVSLEQGKCPKCGKPIKWDRRVTPFVLVLAEGGIEITAGYYALPDARPPPAGRRLPTNLIELPDDDDRKQPNRVRKEVDRHRELISRRKDYEYCS